MTIVKPDRSGNIILNNSLVSFNVTVVDTVTQVYMVVFNLTNNSGTFSVNTTVAVVDNATNSMVVNSSMPIDIAKLQNGNYTLKVIANDTKNNVNATESLSFQVDNSNPSAVYWNYSLVTKQMMIRFNDTLDNATLDLSKLNVTYNDGTPLLMSINVQNYSLQGTTIHYNSNNSVVILSLSTYQDTKMRELLATSEGQLMVTADAIRDIAGNAITAQNVSISAWSTYGIELSFTTSIWNPFNLPLTTLQNRSSSLGSNYSVDNVLASIRGNYAGIYYYTSGAWASYVPGRTVNTFTTFSDNTASNTYWIYMTAADKLQIT